MSIGNALAHRAASQTLCKTYSSDSEVESYRALESHLRESPLGPGELLSHLGLFLTRASLARILFMHDLYLKILDVPGCVMEFGCHWGQNLALFSSFRTIYEPQNIGRKVIGFDTFDGYTESAAEDGPHVERATALHTGAMPKGYEHELSGILDCHNALGSRAHIKKHEVIKGDAADTLPIYLSDNPATVIALAYFDIGLHAPTRKCLETVRDRMPRGGIIGLDHLGMDEMPGDSLAVSEVLGFSNCRFVRDPRVPYQSYVIVG